MESIQWIGVFYHKESGIQNVHFRITVFFFTIFIYLLSIIFLVDYRFWFMGLEYFNLPF